MSIKPWETYITNENLSDAQLVELNKTYFPKMIMSAPTGEFVNIKSHPAVPCDELVTTNGTLLPPKEISKFSDFTIETFYKVHTKYYPPSEIEVFKEHQGVFFSLPYSFIRHEIKSETVAYLTAALIENHPFFKEPVWHIGYWGMSSSIKDKRLRSAIKYDWGDLLIKLNRTARVGGNIDYFNKPAITMAQNYGMKLNGFRMDPR